MIWRTERIGSATVGLVDADVAQSVPDALRDALAAERVVTVRQVHGADVVWTDDPRVSDPQTRPEADALLTRETDTAVLVRVADCTPIAVVDPDRRIGGVVHAGRAGLVAGVVPAAVDELRRAGADRLIAVVGPRICGNCYELPADLAQSVAAVVPAARATTSWGTPSADIGAGVIAQLAERGVEVHDLGVDQCTFEREGQWFSYRRQGAAAGRFAIAVVFS